MREILFRGKNKKWRIGDLSVNKINDNRYYRIMEDDGTYISSYSVKGDTVGQYTGLTDKNNQRVFEGDILKFDWTRGEQYIGEVVWDSEYACFDIKPHAENINAHFGIMNSNEFEVVGNIYDNPELLKAEVTE